MKAKKFQFLLGTLITGADNVRLPVTEEVSIPLRYADNAGWSPSALLIPARFQFLLGTLITDYESKVVLVSNYRFNSS